MFTLESLPACEGDCLVLSWGEKTIRRILIDGGRLSTANVVLAYANRHGLAKDAFELFIITHIDRDHIEGAVALLGNDSFRALVKEVWFNDRGDLQYAPPKPGFETFGALDGERLTTLINQFNIPTNQSFKPAPVAVINESLPVVSFPDGLTLSVLSPDLEQLEALAKPWDDTLLKAPEGWELFGEPEPVDVAFLVKSTFKSDTAKPNGSSIALVAEYDNKHVLLTGDAHVKRILDSLELYRKLHPDFTGFSLVKASHHGSRGNTSLELVQAVRCNNWLISSNGSQFKHPDREAVARIIAGSKNGGKTKVFFNYDTPFTSYWRSPLKGSWVFEPHYGEGGYIEIEVPNAPDQ
jgi:hypothetical protein